MMNLLPWKKKKKSDFLPTHGNEMERMFNRFFDDDFFSPMGMTEGSRYLRADVSEGKSNVTAKIEIPGMEAKDIDVSLDGRFLTVKGEKKQEKEDKGESYHRIERAYGNFMRTIELPAEVDDSSVEASYKKGVLTVKMKKSRPSETRTIKVKTK